MVKLSVRYDKTLKDNVFVVRDDETYVSSTKTLLTVSDEYNPTIEGVVNHLMYRVDITIDVLRDTGDSTIVLYDGEDVLDTFDWTGTAISTHHDFPVDTTHELRAMFMGNKHCLNSQSKTHEVFMASSIYQTNIEYEGVLSHDNYFIKRDTSFTFNIFELQGTTHVPIQEGTVTVSYSDGTHNGILDADVGLDGTATVDFGEDFDDIVKGLFDITAVYNGTQHYARASLSIKVSKYYNAQLSGYWNYGGFGGYECILGQTYYLRGKIVDFFGNPYKELDQVKFYGKLNGTWSQISTGTVDNNGELVLTLPANSPNLCDEYRFGIHTEYGFEELNATFTPTYIEVSRLDVSYTSNPTYGSLSIEAYGYVGDSSTLTRLDYVPVTITSSAMSTPYVDVQDTSERVLFEYDINQYPSQTTFNISCGLASTSHTIHYYITDYVAPTWNGSQLHLVQGSKQALANGMKYTTSSSISSNNPFRLSIYNSVFGDYTNKKLKLTFTVVSASNNRFWHAVMNESGHVTFYNIPGDNWLGAGDTVEYVYDPTTKKLTCTAGGRLRFTQDMSSSTYTPCIGNFDSTGNIVLNNIKLEVLE